MNIYQRNDQFVTFSRGIQARSLNDNIVNRIFVDKNDNIWVGTDFGGINIMAPQRITFNYSLQGYEKGVPNIISTVLEDKEGNILAGIVDGGLAIKRKGADSFFALQTQPGRSALTGSQQHLGYHSGPAWQLLDINNRRRAG